MNVADAWPPSGDDERMNVKSFTPRVRHGAGRSAAVRVRLEDAATGAALMLLWGVVALWAVSVGDGELLMPMVNTVAVLVAAAAAEAARLGPQLRIPDAARDTLEWLMLGLVSGARLAFLGGMIWMVQLGSLLELDSYALMWALVCGMVGVVVGLASGVLPLVAMTWLGALYQLRKDAK